jgi:acetylornithine deacetylase/succinyl-diaminopimelate desuccinylase-like protein
VAAPVALVGVAEKGFVTLELHVDGEAGHSSVPPSNTAIGVLSAAVTKVESTPCRAGSTAWLGRCSTRWGRTCRLPSGSCLPTVGYSRP